LALNKPAIAGDTITGAAGKRLLPIVLRMRHGGAGPLPVSFCSA
jgi:hypothetical protein